MQEAAVLFNRPQLQEALAAALLQWHQEQKEVQDFLTPKPDDRDADLWDNMPEIDSKQALGSSHVFKSILGIDLDTRLLRPGGYRTIQHMIDELVPKMLDLAETKAT
ncbi:MAG: hypothetical protein LC623_04065 [Halobacteriales archaeon]|nr:hypothetical protein [Halobacteriales archaeon]